MWCTSSQWEMALRPNAVSHWLGAYTQWSMHMVKQFVFESSRKCLIYIFGALRCRHMSVKMSHFDWLSNNLFRLANMKTPKFRITNTFCEESLSLTLDSPQNVVSNAERVLMPLRCHGKRRTVVNKNARRGQSLLMFAFTDWNHLCEITPFMLWYLLSERGYVQLQCW